VIFFYILLFAFRFLALNLEDLVTVESITCTNRGDN